MVNQDPHHQQRRASHNTGGQLDGGHTHQYRHREIEWAVDEGSGREHIKELKTMHVHVHARQV